MASDCESVRSTLSGTHETNVHTKEATWKSCCTRWQLKLAIFPTECPFIEGIKTINEPMEVKSMPSTKIKQVPEMEFHLLFYQSNAGRLAINTFHALLSYATMLWTSNPHFAIP